MYQRLLALDEDEALDLLEEYLEAHTLEQVYDGVVVPALALAEQDRHRGVLDETRQAFVRRATRDIVDDLGSRYGVSHQPDGKRVSEKAARERAKGEAKAARSADRSDALSGDRDSAERPSNRSPSARPVAQAKKAVKAGFAGAASSVDEAVGSKLADALGVARPAAPAPAPPPNTANAVVNVVILPAHDDADHLVGTMLKQMLDARGYTTTLLPADALASEKVEAVAKYRAHAAVVSALPPSAVTHSRYLCKRVDAAAPDLDKVVGLWTVAEVTDATRARLAPNDQTEIVTLLSDAVEEVRQIGQHFVNTKPAANADAVPDANGAARVAELVESAAT